MWATIIIHRDTETSRQFPQTKSDEVVTDINNTQRDNNTQRQARTDSSHRRATIIIHREYIEYIEYMEYIERQARTQTVHAHRQLRTQTDEVN